MAEQPPRDTKDYTLYQWFRLIFHSHPHTKVPGRRALEMVQAAKYDPQRLIALANAKYSRGMNQSDFTNLCNWVIVIMLEGPIADSIEPLLDILFEGPFSTRYREIFTKVSGFKAVTFNRTHRTNDGQRFSPLWAAYATLSFAALFAVHGGKASITEAIMNPGRVDGSPETFTFFKEKHPHAIITAKVLKLYFTTPEEEFMTPPSVKPEGDSLGPWLREEYRRIAPANTEEMAKAIFDHAGVLFHTPEFQRGMYAKNLIAAPAYLEDTQYSQAIEDPCAGEEDGGALPGAAAGGGGGGDAADAAEVDSQAATLQWEDAPDESEPPTDDSDDDSDDEVEFICTRRPSSPEVDAPRGVHIPRSMRVRGRSGAPPPGRRAKRPRSGPDEGPRAKRPRTGEEGYVEVIE